MADTNGTPSDAELLKAALTWAMRRIRVHLPATVETVHLDEEGHARAVDVRVDVGEYVRTLEGETPEYEPVIPNVPIEWPGGGGARLTFPLQRGDTGLVLFCDRSMDEWAANATGQVVARDKRTHHLSDAVFAPGLRRPAAPWTGARTDAVTLGFDGGAGGPEPMQIHLTREGIALGAKSPEYAVALAEKVFQALIDLKAAIASAVPVPQDGGVGLQTTLLAGLQNWPPTIGSTTVKVKG